jgi:hypothetical protein
VQVEVPEKDPGTQDKQRKFKKILEERQGGRVVRGAVGVCNSEINTRCGGGERCKKRVRFYEELVEGEKSRVLGNKQTP